MTITFRWTQGLGARAEDEVSSAISAGLQVHRPACGVVEPAGQPADHHLLGVPDPRAEAVGPDLGVRVALVTGSNRGIGLAIVRGLAKQGLRVVLAGRSEYLVDKAVADLQAEGLSVVGHQLDVTDPASVARAMADISNDHGRLDVLVNNAGIAIDRGQQASRPDISNGVRATVETNLFGTWRCCVLAVTEMTKHGYGRIVNLTSHLGLLRTSGTGNVAYRVSKGSVNILTRVLAEELQGSGILVNAAIPGVTNTRMARHETERTAEEAADTPIWLATLPDDGPSGGLFYEREQVRLK